MLTPPATTELRDAIGTLRAVCEDGPPTHDYAELIAAITGLLHLAARMKEEDIGTEDSPPRIDKSAAFQRAAARFPDIDFVSDWDRQVGAEKGSFPANDLSEFYADMCEIDALFEAGHTQHARWEFRFGFESHWAQHALSLLAYMLGTHRL